MADARPLVVDRNNYHLFTPLLYQVATAMLDPSEIAQPVRKLLGPQRNADFLQAGVRGFDLDARSVETDRGSLRYDYLVLAAGSETNYFGIRSLEGRAFGLKELPEGLALRNRILERFEEAQWEESPERRRRLLSFAVIGGGPTGIEFAGALQELIHLMVRRDYPRMDPIEPHVVLLEGADRLLLAFHPDLSEAAHRALVRKGVEVHLGALVLFNWAWEYVFYDRPIRLRLQAGSGPRELAAVEE